MGKITSRVVLLLHGKNENDSAFLWIIPFLNNQFRTSKRDRTANSHLLCQYVSQKIQPHTRNQRCEWQTTEHRQVQWQTFI